VMVKKEGGSSVKGLRGRIINEGSLTGRLN
jgi:hypothetical protein